MTSTSQSGSPMTMDRYSFSDEENFNFREIPADIAMGSSSGLYSPYEEVYRDTVLPGYLINHTVGGRNSGHQKAASLFGVDLDDESYISHCSTKMEDIIMTSSCTSIESSSSYGDDFSYLCGSSSISESTSSSSLMDDCSSGYFNVPKLCFDSLMRSLQVEAADTNNQASFDQMLHHMNELKATLLPPAPFFLEKGKSFTVDGSVQTIVAAVEAALVEAKVMYSFDNASIQWTGKMSNKSCLFDVRVYQLHENNTLQHVLEVRRQEGCCIGFTGFYSHLKGRICSKI
jgi:hypothetical protein